jgi:formylglycine-generating enzyme required for sulfatase activity
MYQLSKFARRHRALVGGFVSVMAALVIGLVVSLFLYRRARTAETEARFREGQESVARSGAEANEKRARDAERRALSLSGIARLDGLIAEADTLWPRYPYMIARFEDWLKRAYELRDELPTYRADLAALEVTADDVRAGTRHFADTRLQWLSDNIHAMVDKLEKFVDAEHGAIADVKARLARAQEIEARTIDDYAKEWDNAIEDIRTSEKYGGLEVEAQIGLVPLGRDSDSQLWEFWVWESGERPESDPSTGHWKITGKTGVVLVLLSGGSFLMGAQGENPRDPNYDDLSGADEGPVHQVTLAPFFIAKYEMTQGQWEQASPKQPNRSFYGKGHPFIEDDYRVHPAESMTWIEARECASHLDLVLPTEAQWEYAARGGTTTRWCHGNSLTGLGATANIYDQRTLSMLALTKSWGEPAPWSDPFTVHGAVGSLAPNAFGLHDVLGNVSEWCLDAHIFYDVPGRPGDGLRWAEDNQLRVNRGGSFSSTVAASRLSTRWGMLGTSTDSTLGMRLARPLTTP